MLIYMKERKKRPVKDMLGLYYQKGIRNVMGEWAETLGISEISFDRSGAIS